MLFITNKKNVYYGYVSSDTIRPRTPQKKIFLIYLENFVHEFLCLIIFNKTTLLLTLLKQVIMKTKP